MDDGNRYRWLWTLIKGAVLFGLVWLSNQFYPHDHFSWLVVIAIVFAFQWFIKPGLEEWLKNMVKQAMREKQLEDDYAQQQAMDDSDL